MQDLHVLMSKPANDGKLGKEQLELGSLPWIPVPGLPKPWAGSCDELPKHQTKAVDVHLCRDNIKRAPAGHAFSHLQLARSCLPEPCQGTGL